VEPICVCAEQSAHAFGSGWSRRSLRSSERRDANFLRHHFWGLTATRRWRRRGGSGLALGGNHTGGSDGHGGYGLFFNDGLSNMSGDHVVSGAAIAYAGAASTGAPRQETDPWVVGAYAGLALGTVTFTNAHSAQQVSGPFTTYSFSVGGEYLGFSVQWSYGSNGVKELGISLVGPSTGLSVSKVTTTTIPEHSRGCQ